MKVTARIKSALAGFIALLIAFNGMAFAFDVNAGAVDHCGVFQALGSQSNVLSYSSFSVLPLKIVNQLFAQSAGLPLPAKNEPSRSDQKKKDASPSAYVPALDFKTIGSSRELPGMRGTVHAGAGLVPGLLHGDPGNAVRPPGSGAGMALLIFFILIMTLLPRGNLDASAIMRAVRPRPVHPFRDHLTGFFYCSRDTHPNETGY